MSDWKGHHWENDKPQLCQGQWASSSLLVENGLTDLTTQMQQSGIRPSRLRFVSYAANQALAVHGHECINEVYQWLYHFTLIQEQTYLIWCAVARSPWCIMRFDTSSLLREFRHVGTKKRLAPNLECGSCPRLRDQTLARRSQVSH
jgi:hypothetical protein